MGKASKKKEQRRQGVGESRAYFEQRRGFARFAANPSPATTAHAWSGGRMPEPAAIPKWREHSVGDRFFSARGIAEAAAAPPISDAALPTPAEIATTPELWPVATNALVRAVVLDGLTVSHPSVLAVTTLLAPVVGREVAYYADETTWDEYPEAYVPLRQLGDDVLMDATWAIVGDDTLEQILTQLERRLDTVFDGSTSLTGRVVAETLIRPFPDHFECAAPSDVECLDRLRATGRTSGNPLLDLVRTGTITPEDSPRVGLTILTALADLARTNASSALDAGPDHGRRHR